MTGERINLSEDAVRRLLAEFKLELVRELQTNYVTLAAFGAVQASVAENSSRLNRLEISNAGRIAISGAMKFAFGIIGVGLLAPTLYLIWLVTGAH